MKAFDLMNTSRLRWVQTDAWNNQYALRSGDVHPRFITISPSSVRM